MKSKHTALPWRLEVDGAGWYICRQDNEHVATTSNACLENGDFLYSEEEEEANAKHILAACNAHDDLVAALKEAIETIEALSGQDNSCDPAADCSDLRAVLAKAGAA